MTQRFHFTGQADMLQGFGGQLGLSEKLTYLHGVVIQQYPCVERIAVAVYDAQTDFLKTFLHSDRKNAPLLHYQAKLSDTPSLLALYRERKSRALNDLEMLAGSNKAHTQWALRQGFKASYTLPIYHRDEFLGFVFFDASRKGAFTPPVRHYLDLIAQILSLAVAYELHCWHTLHGVLNTVHGLFHHRDPETAGHLQRMARYSRLIALRLAPAHGLSDEFVEQVFRFAPLHDIGKLGIPERILLKPGSLTPDEFAIMRTHVSKGREIIDALLRNFGFKRLEGTAVLGNIVELHHETLDGSGYPYGLRHADIPLEARIVAVADIFDALTSQRPYKPAWDNRRAFQTLQELAQARLDPQCVAALLENQEDVLEIQRQFTENHYG